MMSRRSIRLIVAMAFCMSMLSAGFETPDLQTLEAASQKGDASAQTLLGECYFLGIGVDPDHEQAVRWFRRAAAADEPLARYYLGFMGFWGQDPGGAYRDFNRVLSDVYPKLKELAQNGDYRSQRALGTMILYGLGVSPDVEAAVDSLKSAADQGDLRARSMMAMFYLNGVGVPQDDGKAWEILFNDFHLRRRLKADTLVNQRERGYSFLNDHFMVYALEITEP